MYQKQKPNYQQKTQSAAYAIPSNGIDQIVETNRLMYQKLESIALKTNGYVIDILDNAYGGLPAYFHGGNKSKNGHKARNKKGWKPNKNKKSNITKTQKKKVK